MSRDYQRVARAIRYISEHAGEQPSLAQIAGQMHLSPAHAQRVFSRWAGVSPKQFLQFLTVQQAKRALGESESLLGSAHRAGLSGSGRLHDHFVTLESMSPQEYRGGGEGLQLGYGVADTPFGSALAVQTRRGGLCHFSFLDEAPVEAVLDQLRGQWPSAVWHEDAGLAQELLDPLFRASGEAVPITLRLQATNFRLRVWQALLRVPEGSICSYQQLAAMAGKPAAVRAVASAVAANPVAWLIPCHRVIRASGAFGNYRWSTERKQAMLVWERFRRERALSSDRQCDSG